MPECTTAKQEWRLKHCRSETRVSVLHRSIQPDKGLECPVEDLTPTPGESLLRVRIAHPGMVQPRPAAPQPQATAPEPFPSRPNKLVEVLRASVRVCHPD